jgi:hypothetical protein
LWYEKRNKKRAPNEYSKNFVRREAFLEKPEEAVLT